MWWISLLLLQDLDGQAARIRQAMETSLAKQRAAVERQAQSVAAAMGHAVAIWRPAASMSCDPVAAPELDKMIENAAREQNLEPALVREVARRESAFYPCATSPKGAAGMMQLMPETQALFKVQEPMDPQKSLGAGARLLKQLMERYHGDLSLVLSAYNAGAARVDQAGGVPDIAETRQYVSDILGRLHK